METLTDPAVTPVEEAAQVETPAPVVESPPPEPAPEAIPVEVEPEPIPEPVRGRITLVTGREHDVVNVEEVEEAEKADPASWVVFNRPNGTPLKVRASAIISSE